MRFNTLTIENFRGIRQLKLEGLGRVTLLTGKNNTCKSTVLEALRLLATNAAPATMVDILRSREEFPWVSGLEDPIQGESARYILSTLFFNRPEFSDSTPPLEISSNEMEGDSHFIAIKTFWDKDSIASQYDIFDSHESEAFQFDSRGVPSLRFFLQGNRRFIIPTGYFKSLFRKANPSSVAEQTSVNDLYESSIPIQFVNSFNGEPTRILGKLWDKIALTSLEKHVADALRLIEPTIEAVSMIGHGNQRIAIVKTSEFSNPIPLKSFGDGMNRLFAIILSLVNARGGLLLIDEFENGMHHTVQYDAWRIIFKLAKELGVQVFATSHSWDAIVAFQRAAQESPEEGALIRLSRKDETIIPTAFTEKDLEVATREEIEVR